MAVLERRNPADDREVVATYEALDADGARAAVDRAAAAAPGWAATPGPKRAALLHRAANLLEERASEIAREITREEGKLLADALGETLRAVTIMRFHAGEAERLGGETAEPADPGVLAFTRRRPLGVVGLITPWNFPIAIPAWKLAPALAAGNAVVIKPASRAPGGTVALVAALRDAGAPEGVLELAVGGSAVGGVLVDDARVRAVSFTGSNFVGEALRARVTDRGGRFQGELGGNNPLIVLADADVDRAAGLAVSGAFGAAGQKCTATRRVIAEGPVYEAMLARTAELAGALRVGPGLEDGVEVPPLVDRDAQREVLEAVEATVAAGAEAVAGGDRGEADAHGSFVAPTVLAGAGPGTPVIDDEVFGPVVAVLEAADAGAAIELANATPYGLSASVCTNDLSRAIEFVRSIDAGMVHVNRPTPGADPHLPFGGVKASSASGYREQGRAAVEFFTEGQTVYLQGQS
ncbi:MAG: aldehyde dehydrogenase family protein [Actinobacteria bacterium]|nr:aldehyde dehydrogenase family protein [Actinomycetota bacterium]